MTTVPLIPHYLSHFRALFLAGERADPPTVAWAEELPDQTTLGVFALDRAQRGRGGKEHPHLVLLDDAPEILVLPGASAVATQVERLSSKETNKVAQFPRLQVRRGAGRVVA